MLATNAQDSVHRLELWAPVANLEVQTPFAMGPAQIAPITKAMIDALETKALASAPTQQDQIKLLFADMRKEMQGLAAVLVKLEAESDKVMEEGEALARTIVGLLRFFSPTVAASSMLNAVALLGSEVTPSSKLLVLGDDTFAYSARMLSPHILHWQISANALESLRAEGLDAVAALVRPEGLSAFAVAIRSSLLLYSTGATFSDPVDRLVYTLSSLEGVLLKHAAESAEFNIEERMSLLLAAAKLEREDVARNVREAYRLRAKRGASPMAPYERASLATFVYRAYVVLRIVLQNVNSFVTTSDFVTSVDGMKSE